MGLWRSRPQTVEAVQWTGDNVDEVVAFAPLSVRRTWDGELELWAGQDGAQGWVPVPLWHWVVHRPGDLTDMWPVDPDYFAGKYDPVAETSTLTDKETPMGSNLAEHARRELTLCRQMDEDPEYAESIVRAVEAFASFGHSGGSAAVAREQLYTLLGWGTLSPLTSAPDEWEDRSEESGYPMWQSRRDPAVFSDNGGKTWWHLDEKEAPVADVDPRLTALMEDCGRALYDDREWNAPVYDEQGEIVGGNGANPFEAAFALDAVAQILGIEGPTAVHDRLCESEACPAHEPADGGGDGE